MGEIAKCPDCGRDVPAEAPGGACPHCALAAALPAAGAGPTADEVAAALPAFEILGVLGRGGMGVVFKARQKALDRIVALKVLPPAAAKAPGFADRFQREAKAMARLAHPNIVAVYEFGQVVDEAGGGLFFLVLEFVDGVNVREAMAAGRIRADDALTIVPQICDALQYAHDRGVVHRDIKPENVLIGRDGQVKIADFGLAKLADREAGDLSLTGAGQVMGTLRYMAPEQWERPKDVDHRADIYSLGVVFYEMLTGELPVGKFEPPSRRAAIDVRVDEVVMRSIERDRERRWQHASDMKTQMSAISSGAAVAPPPRAREPAETVVPTATRPSRGAATVAVAVAIALAAVAWTQSEGFVRFLGVLFAGFVAAIPWLPHPRRLWPEQKKWPWSEEKRDEEPDTPEDNAAWAVELLVIAVVCAVAAVATGWDWLWWCAGPAAFLGAWCGATWAGQRVREAARAPAATAEPKWLSPWMLGLAATAAMALIGVAVWSTVIARESLTPDWRVGDAAQNAALVLALILCAVVAARAVLWRRRRATGRVPLGAPVLVGVVSVAALLLAAFCVVYSMTTLRREPTVVEFAPGMVFMPPPPSTTDKPAAEERAPWDFEVEMPDGRAPTPVFFDAQRQGIWRAWTRLLALQGDDWSDSFAGLYGADDFKVLDRMQQDRRKESSGEGVLGLPLYPRERLKLAAFRIERVRLGGPSVGVYTSADVHASHDAQTLRFTMRLEKDEWRFAMAPVELEVTDAAGQAVFHTTRWSVVLAAADADAEASREALATLCAAYWYPLYAFARRRGADRHDAADLVQGFFVALIEKDWAADADPERGRFRAFLLTAFRRFCTKDRAREATLKRGAGRAAVSLDFDDGESRFQAEAGQESDPERAFERRWALTLLARALERTRREFEDGGRAELFVALVPYVGGAGETRPYAEIAARLSMSEGALKVAVHRLRARYRDNVRAEIRDTVSDDAAVDDEIRRLMEAVAS